MRDLTIVSVPFCSLFANIDIEHMLQWARLAVNYGGIPSKEQLEYCTTHRSDENLEVQRRKRETVVTSFKSRYSSKSQHVSVLSGNTKD